MRRVHSLLMGGACALLLGLMTAIGFSRAATPPSRCIEPWPAAPRAAPRPSLAGRVPEIRWRKTLPWNGYEMETVLAGEHLAITGGNKLLVLDRAGDIIGEYLDGQAQLGSAPVADPDGNFYFATSRLISVNPGGRLRWSMGLGQNLDPSSETTHTSTLLLSPDGLLYFAASDGFLYAVRSSDGSMAWRRQVGLREARYVRAVTAGVGDTIVVDGTLYTRGTGAPSGQLRVDGKPVTPAAWSYQGLVAVRHDEVGGQRQARTYLLDSCGAPRWALPNRGGGWFIYLVGFDDKAIVRGGDQWYVYSRDGEPLLGPVSLRGFPTTLGADGTFYDTVCSSGDPWSADMSVVAYSANLKELWEIKLGGPCTYAGTTLAEDGTLYVTRQLAGSGGIELIAVQTASPGVAATAYPTRRQDNRRTSWLSSTP